MTDYISREAALEGFESCNAGNPNWTPQRVKTLLLRQHAADVAEVVRCKGCKYVRDLGFNFGGLRHESYFCVYNGPVATGGNDFCSHGEFQTNRGGNDNDT